MTIALVACGEAAPATSPTSEVEENLSFAPTDARLKGVQLPDNEAAILSIFDRLPSEIGEMTLATTNERGPERYASFYFRPGSNLPNAQMLVLDVSTGDFFPAGSTAKDVIEIFKTGADWSVLSSGEDENLVWLEYHTTASIEGDPNVQQIYVAQWGHPNSNWVFAVQADNPEDMLRVLNLFLLSMDGAAS
ncbi:MAG: hypothetical protein O2854_09265 [Chloroflexi bacterium]|nr:hypothetical protein [Chloroflexota bacterium]